MYLNLIEYFRPYEINNSERKFPTLLIYNSEIVKIEVKNLNSKSTFC